MIVAELTLPRPNWLPEEFAWIWTSLLDDPVVMSDEKNHSYALPNHRTISAALDIIGNGRIELPDDVRTHLELTLVTALKSWFPYLEATDRFNAADIDPDSQPGPISSTGDTELEDNLLHVIRQKQGVVGTHARVLTHYQEMMEFSVNLRVLRDEIGSIPFADWEAREIAEYLKMRAASANRQLTELTRTLRVQKQFFTTAALPAYFPEGRTIFQPRTHMDNVGELQRELKTNEVLIKEMEAHPKLALPRRIIAHPDRLLEYFQLACKSIPTLGVDKSLLGKYLQAVRVLSGNGSIFGDPVFWRDLFLDSAWSWHNRLSRRIGMLRELEKIKTSIVAFDTTQELLNAKFSADNARDFLRQYLPAKDEFHGQWVSMNHLPLTDFKQLDSPQEVWKEADGIVKLFNSLRGYLAEHHIHPDNIPNQLHAINQKMQANRSASSSIPGREINRRRDSRRLFKKMLSAATNHSLLVAFPDKVPVTLDEIIEAATNRVAVAAAMIYGKQRGRLYQAEQENFQRYRNHRNSLDGVPRKKPRVIYYDSAPLARQRRDENRERLIASLRRHGLAVEI